MFINTQPRHFGLAHYQTTRLPMRAPRKAKLVRLAIVFGAGLAVSLAGVMSSKACTFTNDGRTICASREAARRVSPHKAEHHRAPRRAVTVIGGRPKGCPVRFCGCGLRKFLGLDDKRLNRAWAWAEMFPRVSAKPGAAAVRRHHVMLLQEHVGGHDWLVRDYNSGNGLSRIHVRNVRGYVFVDPNGNELSARAK